MPRPRSANLFELGGYWIRDDEKGRPGLWRYWYDAGYGRVRRARCAGETLEQAKLEIAELIVKGTPKSASSYLAVVLENYTRNVTSAKPSADPATRAVALVVEFMTAVKGIKTPRVSEFDERAQREFAAWCARNHEHAVKTISRNLSVIAASFAYGGLDVEVTYQPGDVANMLEQAKAPIKNELRRFIPTDLDLARFLDHAGDGRLFRACIIMLTTACRPEAALDLAPAQVNREIGTAELNPLGRRQTRKHRPIVRVPTTLLGWLDAWEEEARLKMQELTSYVGFASVDSLQSAVTRVREKDEVKLPVMVAYSLRHKIASVLRRSRVSEDQIAQQLGHVRPHLRTTGGYGEFGPDYLKEAADAIDAYMVRLQTLTKRALFATTPPAAPNVIPLEGSGATRDGWIYFIEAVGQPLVKIGWSADPVGRLKSLLEQSPTEMRLITGCRGRLGDERRLHLKFHRLRQRSEWFRCEPTLAAHVNEVLQANGACPWRGYLGAGEPVQAIESCGLEAEQNAEEGGT